MNHWKPAVLAMTSAGLMGLAGCGSPIAHPPALLHRSQASIALSPPDTINPLRTQTVSGANIDSLFYDSLVTLSPKLRPKADLALHWQALDGGKVWEFWLNPRAKWWNGHPVTAHDVVWTYQLEAQAASGFPSNLSVRQTIQTVTAPAPDVVKFVLRQPDGAFLANFAAQNSGNWILPAFLLDKLPASQVAASPRLNRVRDMVGTGPYEPVQYRQNIGLDLKANPHYFLGRPHIAALHMRFVANRNTIGTDLLRRRLDLALNVPLNAQSTLLHNSAVTRFYRFQRSVRWQYQYLVFNFKATSLFASRHVRWGLTEGLNRQGIIQHILHGSGQLANGIVPPASWAYNPQVASKYPYRPRHAALDLHQAGWKRGPHGVLVHRGGQRLAFTLLIPAGSATDAAIATTAQANWRSLGVLVTIQALPHPAYVQALIAGHFQMALAGWGIGADPDQTAIYASNQTPPNGQNLGSYDSQRVNRLLQQETAIANQAQRKRIFQALQVAMLQNPPGIFLYFPDPYYAVAKTLSGFQFNPVIGFYQPQKWVLRPGT